MNKIKRIIRICFSLLISVIVATAAGCSANEKSEVKKPKTTLEISAAEVELNEDETIVLTATTNSDETVKWYTSDEKIASVSASGRVIAKTVGEATISAQVENLTEKCKVKVVKNADGTVIELEKAANLSLATGAEKIVGSVTINGEKSALDKNNATFAVDNDKIAKVSADGTITPITPGSTFVFVTSGKKTKVVSVEVYTMLIATAEDWNAMLSADGDLNARYLVVNDIDFTNTEYAVKTENSDTVILSNSFAGYLDGGGHSIKNITMPSTLVEQSLFGTVVGLEMKNISFENVKFTSVACGIAVRMIQHYDEVDENGNVIPDSTVVAYNNIKNVSFDFVYENNGIRGICGKYYGGGLENVFLNMRMANGGKLNKATDYAVTNVFYVWQNNNYLNNVIVLAENGDVSTDWTVTEGSRDVSKDLIFVFGNKMEACYKARTIFDPVVWSVIPGELPKLK